MQNKLCLYLFLFFLYVKMKNWPPLILLWFSSCTSVYVSILDYPNLDYPNLDYPNLDYPNLDYPNLDYPNLDYPNLDYPNLDYPNLDYPNLDYPNLDYPNLDYPNLDYPNLNYPNRVHSKVFCLTEQILDYPNSRNTLVYFHGNLQCIILFIRDILGESLLF